jgi:hypothetical protein
MEDAKRIDKEGRMAVAQNSKATLNVDERVRGVANQVVAIDNMVTGVGAQGQALKRSSRWRR